VSLSLVGKELTVFFASDKMQAFNHELGTEPKFLSPMHSKAITETSGMQQGKGLFMQPNQERRGQASNLPPQRERE